MVGLNWFHASFCRTFYLGSNEQFEANTVKAKTKITAKAAPWPTTQASRDGHYSMHSESIRDEHGSGLKPILAGSGLDRTEKIFDVLMW